jgi:hypothetical protein
MDGDLMDFCVGGCRYPPHRNSVVDDTVVVANDRG